MNECRPLYINLLKRAVSDILYDPGEGERRTQGRDFPRRGYTMIGLRRLENIQACLEDILAHQIPGDVLEAGVWRGGACIFMRGLLKAYGIADRRVWVADSFAGLPPPDAERYPADTDSQFHKFPFLAITMEQVQEHFRRFDLLDEQVGFLPGWFSDSLPTAPIERLALLRIDADMYGSTWEVLDALYPRLSPGGYVIIDDYHHFQPCRQAVDDYRMQHGITSPIQRIDWCSVCWRMDD